MITDDKRAFHRIKKKVKIKYKYPEKTAVEYTSESKNISMGGVYFITVKEFKTGEMLDCKISSDKTTEESHWKARVVRCEVLEKQIVNTFGVAVEFVSAVDDSEKILKQIISS